MAPTPESASVPIDDYVLRSDEPIALTTPQLSTYLLQTLKKNASLGPNDPAQIDGDTGKALSYQEFLEQSVRTASALRAMGLVPGDTVSLITRNQVYTFTTAVAIYLAALQEHPMYAYLEQELVEEQIQTVKPSVVFTEAFALPRVRAAIKPMSPKPRVVVFDGESADADMLTMEEFLRLGSNIDVDSFQEGFVGNPDEDNGLIIFTTGSTGPPKPVVHTSKSVHHLMHMSSNVAKDSALYGPLISWITGQGLLLVAMNDRFTMIYSTELNLEKQSKFVHQYKIRCIVSSPFAALQMALQGPYPEHLQRIILGGSPLRKCTEKIIRKAMGPAASLQVLYGSTETGLVIGHGYGDDAHRHFTNGHLRPGVELQVRQVRSGRALGPNQRGEIFIRAPSTAKEYLHNPELTREVIDENGWVKTGDYGYYDEDKFVYVLDRLKDIVFYKDHTVLPSDLSDVIRLHPDVMDAAVYPLPHPLDGQHPLAFISLKPGKSITEEEINEHVAKYADDSHQLRGGIVFLDRVPRTLSGKIVSTALLHKVQQMVDGGAS